MNRSLSRLWVALALASTAMTSVAFAQAQFDIKPIERYQLVSTRGTVINEKQAEGRWWLLYLGSTRCGDRCRAPLRLMQEIMGQLNFWERRHLSAALLSVEPRSDDVAKLQDYLQAHRPHVQGLTGSSFNINIAAKALGVAGSAVCRADGSMALENDDMHVAQIYLVKPGGQLVTTWHESTPASEAVKQLRLFIANNS
ncbi:MAG: SCO family protein [Burkholderiales bacterium]|nr:MAG: SCO family protein [Burkholderiales bacterium]